MDPARRAVHAARVERGTGWSMLALASAMLPLILLPLLVEVPAATVRLMDFGEWAIWAVFAVELGVKTYLAPDRRRYLITHWFDVLIVLLPFLRPLRLLRLVAILARVGVTWRLILGRRSLIYASVFGSVSVVAIAALVLAVEQRDGSGPIGDFPTALWWAAATVTTVGYGDVAPVTWAGRGMGTLLMVVGIGLFGIFTASVAAYFIGSDADAPPERPDLENEIHALREQVATLQDSLDGKHG